MPIDSGEECPQHYCLLIANIISAISLQEILKQIKYCIKIVLSNNLSGPLDSIVTGSEKVSGMGENVKDDVDDDGSDFVGITDIFTDHHNSEHDMSTDITDTILYTTCASKSIDNCKISRILSTFEAEKMSVTTVRMRR